MSEMYSDTSQSWYSIITNLDFFFKFKFSRFSYHFFRLKIRGILQKERPWGHKKNIKTKLFTDKEA